MLTASELYGEYLASTSEDEARQILDRLFGDWLMAWCREAVERNLSCYGLRDVDRADLTAEVVADVLLAMMLRLQAARNGSAEPVNNIRAYLVSTAQNACFGRIRTRCPRHVQLQNRVRYLLRNDVRFASWPNEQSENLAGLAEWSGRPEAVPCPELQRANVPLDEALETLFALAEGPLRVVEVVCCLAAALGISDSAAPPVDPDSLPSPGRATEDRLLERESLSAIWGEVRELPRQQRMALLLNLRDSEGCGVIELLPVTGLASFADIAGLLQLTEEKLAEIWNDLPLEDARIAELLQITRQQVINLRKSARDRLGRRKRKMEGNKVETFASRSGGGLLGSLAERVFGRKGNQ